MGASQRARAVILGAENALLENPQYPNSDRNQRDDGSPNPPTS